MKRAVGWRLLKHRRGAVAIEFAFIFPVFFMLVVAIMELANYYAIAAMIEGAALEASRFGSTGQGGELDDETRAQRIGRVIRENTYGLIDPADLTIDVREYPCFQCIDDPTEPFTDGNGNGTWDTGESFVDVNGNGVWDLDMSTAGEGGANEIVVYTISYVHEGLTGFLDNFLVGLRHESVIAIRNEPF